MFQNEREMLIPTHTFASMLRLAMREADIESYAAFETLLKENDVLSITDERIREYCNLIYTPSFEKAKQLFSVLDFDIDDDDLRVALQENRDYIKNNPKEYKKKNDREIRISVRIRLSRLLPQKSPQNIEAILSRRIEQLCGDGTKYTEYIQALIAKDLQAATLDDEFLEYMRNEEESHDRRN